MARRIPRVADGTLHITGAQGGTEIAVGSASWVAWLRESSTRSFSFSGPDGTFTARKVHRVHGDKYWTAYRKRGGRLRKAYLGKAEKLTLEKLNEAASVLDTSHRRRDRPAVGGVAATVHEEHERRGGRGCRASDVLPGRFALRAPVVRDAAPRALRNPSGSTARRGVARVASGRAFAGRTPHRAFSCGWPTSATRWSRWTRRPSAKGSRRPASMKPKWSRG